MSTGFALDTKKDTAELQYLEWMRQAFAAGKSMTGLIRDVASLAWGPGKLLPNEYFLYQLYDDQRFSPEAKRTYIGTDSQAAVLKALGMPWPEIASDKPTLTALLRGYDLPIPETQAMRHARRSFPGAMPLRSKAEVERFMRSEARYPLFSKPTNSVCSLGVANFERYDASDDCLVTMHGRRVPVGEFAEAVEKYSEGGYLFQTRLAPHAQVASVLGKQLSTVRMFVLVDDEGPVLLRASWKIPSGETVADNFWRAGNMLGGIDVETGRLIRVLRRTHTGTEPIEAHPKSGVSFKDLVFPEWNQMRAAVMQGAAALSSCHFQGWDVALTDQGPILIEVEGDGGDPIMEQLCFDTGLLQGRYLEFTKKAFERRKEANKKYKDRLRKRRQDNYAQLALRRSPKAAEQPADGDGAEVGAKQNKHEAGLVGANS